MMRARVTLLLLIFAVGTGVSTSEAQEIILDRQVRAGELTLFPSVRDPNKYYYVADKARLATHDNGDPQFSFLRYIQANVSSDAENDEGSGGGIVHALVELGVTDEQLDDARNDLRRLNGSGQIIGPVPFKSGTFALISAFAEAGSEFTDQVLGVGNAPVLENEKAAVSLSLTEQGAKVLWESFNTATPDISFSFNMEIDGYRAPKRALIEANFDRIYEHQNFAAGIATPVLQAEISAAFDDMRSEGAIKVTQTGEDEKMEALVQTAYNRLTELMFDKSESSGMDLGALASSANNTPSMLDKASTLLASNRAETRTENDAIRARNEAIDNREATAAQSNSQLEETRAQVEAAEAGAEDIENRAESMRAIADRYESQAEQEQDTARAAELRQLATRFREQAGRYDNMAVERHRDANTRRGELDEQAATAAQAESLAENAGEREEVQDLPSLAIVASYRMKRVRQRGSFTVDLNKYTIDTLALRFDENIGDMTRYLNDEEVFYTVDITSNAFSQRELPVYIDGLNVQDFGQYINFVTVLMSKQHENGNTSSDEVRIDRNNFQESANNFKLSYRKVNDTDQDKFLDYQYRVLWNFFGGAEVDVDWVDSSRSGIPLNPPYQRRSVFLEATPQGLSDASIKSIEFKLYYQLGDREQVKRLSLRPGNNEGISQQLEFMLPESEYEYVYEIDWRMQDNSRVSTGRIESEDGTIYLDEVTEV